MNLSVFEIIGPIMVGPSSSHTAGMARIGLVAHQVLPADFSKVRLTLHSAIRYTYSGHHTDVALIGGLLGFREFDPMLSSSKDILEDRDIAFSVDFWDDSVTNPNTVRIEVTAEGGPFSLTGISVGGGSISIVAINNIPVSLSSSEYSLVAYGECGLEDTVASATGIMPVVSSASGRSIYTLSGAEAELNGLICTIKNIKCICWAKVIHPVLEYGVCSAGFSSITSLDSALITSADEGIGLDEIAIRYEITRSGHDRSSIEERMLSHLKIMSQAAQLGLSGKTDLNYGLLDGQDSLRLMDAVHKGRTLSGNTICASIARAIAIMEVNASSGCVVASPTAGSCGVVPGCFLTVQEKLQLSDETVARALFVAALIGVVMDNRGVSFSGVVGGCQAEIGVSSAISAAGLAYLGGGDAKTCCHAAALATKNLLGLICDPIGGPVEVPCIKRNSVGVANAFAAADMALSGITSYIPPDEVIDSLADVEKRLPPSLKGTATGGLASTETAKCFRCKMTKE